MRKKGNDNFLDLNGKWENLCGIYRDSTFLNSFKIKESQTQLVLVQGNLYKSVIIIFSVLGFGLFMFGLSFFLPTFGFEGPLDIFCCFIGLTGGGAMLCGAVLLASQRNKIIFNKNTLLTTIRYGFFPFAKSVICQSQHLKLRLYQIDIHQATQFLDIGDSILSIYHLQDDTLELIIGTCKQRDILSQAQKRITEFIGAASIDETWEEYELPNGEIVHYQKTPIVKDREHENYRFYTELSPDVVVLSRRWKEPWGLILSTIIGIAFIPSPLVAEDISEFVFIAIFALPLGLFMLSVGLYFLIRFLKNRLVVIDKIHGTIQYQSTRKGFGYKKEICKLSNIAFLQFCLWVEESSGISTSGVFELNCVDKTGIRYNLCNSKDGTQLFENANKLSDQFNVPLVDSVPW